MIKFTDVTKIFDKDTLAVDHVSFTINQGDFITLIGPSGCGKTTLLKMINGLIEPTSGEVAIHNKLLKDWKPIDLRRNIGYVIQQIGLFPHMNIKDNITYVLRLTGQSNLLQKAKELVELVGLDEHYLKRYPWQLSGGQQQRIGVARALAANPDIILMDEPFGALDGITRKQLQEEIIALQEKLKKTIIFVTHDIQEALKLGRKIVIMDQGKIIQVGSPLDFLLNPANDFVRNFIGENNFYLLTNLIKVKDAMEKAVDLELPIDGLVISSEHTLSKALELMFISGQRELSVTENGQIIGKVSFVNAFQKLNKETGYGLS